MLQTEVVMVIPDLFEHPEEHLATPVTEGWRLVRMYGEAVRPDLYTGSVPQGLRADDHLHYAAIVDITARADHLQDVGGGVIMSEVITFKQLKIKR